jgi:hypothetical protein
MTRHLGSSSWTACINYPQRPNAGMQKLCGTESVNVRYRDMIHKADIRIMCDIELRHGKCIVPVGRECLAGWSFFVWRPPLALADHPDKPS